MIKNVFFEDEKFRYDVENLVKIFLGNATPEEPIHLVGNDKLQVKRALYDILQQRTGYKPPWGILTGVRPGKILDQIYSDGMKQGKTPSEIQEVAKKILKEEHRITEDKINLLFDIHKNQDRYFDSQRQYFEKLESKGFFERHNPISLYIGIPFCPTRCAYCSFPANKREDKDVRAYLDALKQEIQTIGNVVTGRKLPIETVYMGGGTPTSLTAEELDELLDCLRMNFSVDMAFEFTVEAGRPDTITVEKLAVMKNHGVGRISINPQTMKQATLDAIGRRHSTEEMKQAVAIAKESGIPVINMDMIAGLPNETVEDFADSLRQIIDFEPNNITVHTLAIKKSSTFKDQGMETSADIVEKMVNISQEELKKAGFGAYYLYRQKYMSGNLENVGYATIGTENGYNIKIMEEKQTIIALGAGGISKFYYPEEDRLERVANVSNFQVYMDRIDEMIGRKLDFFEKY